jgi:hypothetical protein
MKIKMIFHILLVMSIVGFPFQIAHANTLTLTRAQNVKDSTLIQLNPIPQPSGGIKHAPALQVVNAYICGDVVTVAFTAVNPVATITITNKLTDECIYTGLCNSSIQNINLTLYVADADAIYTIAITTASWSRYGEFAY